MPSLVNALLDERLTLFLRVDGNGIIIWANQAELDLLGYQKEEYIGMSISDIHADENSFNDILARLKNFENLENYPTVLKTKSNIVFLYYLPDYYRWRAS